MVCRPSERCPGKNCTCFHFSNSLPHVRYLHWEKTYLCKGYFNDTTVKFIWGIAGIPRVLQQVLWVDFLPKSHLSLKGGYQLQRKQVLPARLTIPALECCQVFFILNHCLPKGLDCLFEIIASEFPWIVVEASFLSSAL